MVYGEGGTRQYGALRNGLGAEVVLRGITVSGPLGKGDCAGGNQQKGG
jgi:hypothetical protein